MFKSHSTVPPSLRMSILPALIIKMTKILFTSATLQLSEQYHLVSLWVYSLHLLIIKMTKILFTSAAQLSDVKFSSCNELQNSTVPSTLFMGILLASVDH